MEKKKNFLKVSVNTETISTIPRHGRMFSMSAQPWKNYDNWEIGGE